MSEASRIFAEGFVAQGRHDGEPNTVIREAAEAGVLMGFIRQVDYDYIMDILRGDDE